MEYPKAPIVEALIDIQIKPLDIDPETFSKATEHLNKDFPNLSLTIVVSGEFTVDSKAVLKTDGNSKPNGKMYSNPEKNRHIQMRTNGYTFNMQAPYTNWDEFYSTAISYFKLYKSIVPEIQIERISTRFINKFLVPLPLNNLQEIFHCLPPLPEGFPKTLQGYFMSTQTPFVDENLTVSITHTMLNQEENNLPFVLDLEVSSIGEIKEEELDKKFNRFRELKNKAFENSVTPKTKERFK